VFRALFRAGSIPGSFTKDGPGRKAWPALFLVNTFVNSAAVRRVTILDSDD